MTTELMTAPKSATTKKPCDCGCSGTSECCELECLVQPRFFCGQLLADQDLTAMVDWVKAKSALQRFRDGWGVVCGLDIQCAGGGTVTVSPGYAIDCCGRDIVICKETTFNAAECWLRDPDPCAPDGAKKNTPAHGVANIAQAVWHTGGPATAGYEWPKDMQAVDVFVRYSESQSGGRSTLSRGTNCGGGCEYTRIDEGGELYCRPAKGCEPPDDPLALWDERYAGDSRRVAITLIEAAQKEDFGTFHDHIRRHGLRTFCFAGEWLCDVERKYRNEPHSPGLTEVLLEIVPWLVQDWRNQRLIRPCASCGTESGIRLARVFLGRERSGSKESFKTLYVTAAPPFRRLLARDEFPVAPRHVNLAPYIWQPVGTAVEALRRADVHVLPKTQDFDRLARFESIVVPEHSEIEAHMVVDFCNTERIAFFATPHP